MESAEIRRRFLDYFARNQHTVVPSTSLVSPDPSLLFTVAGMVPFIPYLTGREPAPYPRAVSVQKCVRTVDIEEVGRTTRHGTFFQMNGNFSFGDYFKEGAIGYAWELVTGSPDQGGYGFDPGTIWVTVYEHDDEAYELWRKIAWLPEERIQRRGRNDNFWHTGQPGPGGPCSEIYVDRGPEYGPEGGPIVDEDRFLEIWNLVFMQYEVADVRSKAEFRIVQELPAQNIDTGMGLERVAYLLQGVDNLYEIDEVYPVLARGAELAGVRYGADHGDDVRLRVVADHVRSALMLIADGVVPSNEARGYVVRRLLRRSARMMRLLGVDAPVLPELLPVSAEAMRASYPEVHKDFARISDIAYGEEEAFRATLRAGTQMFDLAAEETRQAGSTTLSGDTAFRLHDTYGFPVDLTLEMAEEQGLHVDQDEFRRLMTEQRERAKADARLKKIGPVDLSVYRELANQLPVSVEFTGYDEVTTQGSIRGLLVAGGPARAAQEGDEVEVVLDRTPFYAEGGGQLADQGVIEVADGGQIEVIDVQSPLTGLIVHRGRVLAGEVAVGTPAQGLVDVGRRRAISRSHTATHMVHKAFREALGEAATQAGSENAPGRFRFDFTASGPVPRSVLADVEARVNELLIADLEVHAQVMSQQEALAIGALALFGEKYGDRVRVVSVGEWARELCGGTHARRSGQLGVVKLLGESSIGQGVRRVEALVGTDAYRYLAREHTLVAQLTEALKVRPEELPDRVAAIVARLRDAEKELQRIRLRQLLASAPQLARAARDIFGVSFIGYRLGEEASGDDLRQLATQIRANLPAERPGVVAVCGVVGERPLLVVAVNDKGREWDLRAGALVREAAQVLGGGGGGKDDVAQGGGTDTSGIDAALSRVEHLVGATVTGGS
ncbi:MAG: alanine--tRNA ligase [Jiangellaceae bacterium]|nr:alanine--tRNA ligase [Jiangellaceae bacterium]